MSLSGCVKNAPIYFLVLLYTWKTILQLYQKSSIFSVSWVKYSLPSKNFRPVRLWKGVLVVSSFYADNEGAARSIFKELCHVLLDKTLLLIYGML